MWIIIFFLKKLYNYLALSGELIEYAAMSGIIR